MMPPTSEPLGGLPDGRTAFVAEQIANLLQRAAHRENPVTNVRQLGYGPAEFDVQILEDGSPNGLIATVSVSVKRA